MSVVAKWLDGLGYHLVGHNPCDVVLDGDPAVPTERGTAALPHFVAHVYCGQMIAHLRNC